MKDRNRPPGDPAFNAAWTLFCTLHDAPTPERAEALVRWLGRCPQHVGALDDVLTLWALTGAALMQSALEEARDERGPLQ